MKKLVVAVCGLLLLGSVVVAADAAKPTVKVSLTMSVTGDIVWAYLTVKAPANASGMVTVKWIPPSPTTEQVKAGKYCVESTYDLKYVGPRWRTKANRRIHYEGFSCTGTWSVVVLDADGNELAKGQIEVPK